MRNYAVRNSLWALCWYAYKTEPVQQTTSFIASRGAQILQLGKMLEWLGLSSATGSAAAAAEAEKAAPAEKPKCKACCACPETKKARDECVIEKGESECGDLIEEHKKCMRSLGFKI